MAWQLAMGGRDRGGRGGRIAGTAVARLPIGRVRCCAARDRRGRARISRRGPGGESRDRRPYTPTCREFARGPKSDCVAVADFRGGGGARYGYRDDGERGNHGGELSGDRGGMARYAVARRFLCAAGRPL